MHRRGVTLFVGSNGQSAGDPGRALPAVKSHQHDEERQRVAKEGQHRQSDDHERHGRLEVDQRQDQLLHPAAKMRRQKTQQHTQRGRQERADEGHQQADANRDHQPGQHIPAQFVGPQPMRGRAPHERRRQQAGTEVELAEAVGRQHVGRQRHRHHDHHPQDGEHNQRRTGAEETADPVWLCHGCPYLMFLKGGCDVGRHVRLPSACDRAPGAGRSSHRGHRSANWH